MIPTVPTRSLAVIAAFAPLACAHAPPATAADPGAPSRPVEMRFAWPDGFQTNVLIAHESRRRGAEPTGLVARQRLVSERRGTDIWVFTREIAARGDEPDLESTVKINEALVQVVGGDGKFRRAEGVDEALSSVKVNSAEERESARQALIRSAAWEWELMVGAWAGEKLTPGTAYHKQAKASVPLLATVPALLDVEYELEGRVPCSEDEGGAWRCPIARVYRLEIEPRRWSGCAACHPLGRTSRCPRTSTPISSCCS